MYLTPLDNRGVDDDSEIQAGAKVTLLSGGPEMTVQARSLNLVYCSWEQDEEQRHGTFTLDSIQLVSLAPGDALLRRAPMPAQAPPVAFAPPVEGELPTPPDSSEPPEAA